MTQYKCTSEKLLVFWPSSGQPAFGLRKEWTRTYFFVNLMTWLSMTAADSGGDCKLMTCAAKWTTLGVAQGFGRQRKAHESRQNLNFHVSYKGTQNRPLGPLFFMYPCVDICTHFWRPTIPLVRSSEKRLRRKRFWCDHALQLRGKGYTKFVIH
jgi:hypothetical protein